MIVSTLATLSMVQGAFVALPQNYQMFADDALAWATRSPRYSGVEWPSAAAPTAHHNFVPEGVWVERDTWLRRMMRPEWVPDDLRARTIAFRQHQGEDILALRFRKADSDVQIMDFFGRVALVVKGPQVLSFPTNTSEVDGFVRHALQKFLNLTPAEMADAKIEGRFLTDPADTVYSFSIGSTVGHRFQPSWWMARGFTDGKAIYFSMTKTLDEQQTFGGQQAATENMGTRFLPGG